jgi:decaprenylphospho-beta-D-ribofuranose 2-oxidase
LDCLITVWDDIMNIKKQNLAGWGNYPTIVSSVYRPESLEQLQKIVRHADIILPFGNHRSYGDSALATIALDVKKLDNVLSFDKEKGILKAEAGLLVSDLLDIIVPYGWFISVTPGTKFVTLGGCVGANVHGKNHHKDGSFIKSTMSLEIVTADGKLVQCSPKKNKDLYQATFGGMGLTGVVYSIEIKLTKISSSFIEVENTKCENLDELFEALEDSDDTYQYTVAWIDSFAQGDSLGRGVLIAGNHSTHGSLTKAPKQKYQVPITMPTFLLNRLTLRLFNTLYYALNKTSKKLVHFNEFFYPLDAIHKWNRIYGSRGFTQYQFVLPLNQSREGVREIMEKIAASRTGSFLSVLKRFGKENNYISFPMEGYTLAMDFPMSKETVRLLQELDLIVKKRKGRIYLAKDALMTEQLFKDTYPQARTWIAIKKKYDPKNKFTSMQAKRVGL